METKKLTNTRILPVSWKTVKHDNDVDINSILYPLNFL